MAGIVYYVLFLAAGFLYANRLFADKSVYFKLWTGGIIGNVVLMTGIIPFALLFGFTETAHLFLAAAVAAVCVILRPKDKIAMEKPHIGAALTVGGISLAICVLLVNHVMAPVAGGISSGQSTYGDLAMHMGFVTSIAEQGKFPPEYNLLSGTRLCYPFLVDSLSSSLYLFGTDLRSAILLPSFVFAALTVSGFYFMAEKLTENKKTAVLGTVLFFFGGGFGFSYFADGAGGNAENFTRMFTEYYHTPTNYNEHNIRWANAVCDMIIPQRTTMAGWCVLFFALYMLCSAIKTGKRTDYAVLGITAGCMPMIHTHSFLALGIMSACAFFCFFPKTDKKSYLCNQCLYGIIAAALSVGQLCFWTFNQSLGNDAFLRISLGWLKGDDPFLWFWIKNLGVTALLIVPSFFGANGVLKRFCIGGAVIFAISNVVAFQPNLYDNNKLIFVSYMIAVIAVSEYMINSYNQLKNIGGARILAVTVVFFSVFSGVLTVVREFASGGEYMTFTDGEIRFAEFVKDNTEKDAVFASGSEHLNPVCVLAGRNVYAGAEIYVYYHGLGDELYERYGVLRELYEGENTKKIAEEHGIDYIYVSDREREEYRINHEALSELDTIYDADGILLYKIR